MGSVHELAGLNDPHSLSENTSFSSQQIERKNKT